MWSISDISTLGRFLLAAVKLETERQNFRQKTCVTRKMTKSEIEGKLIGKDFQVVPLEIFAGPKKASLSQCLKPVKKCGGVQNLHYRGDECEKFIEASTSLYGHTVAEIEAAVLVSTNTATVVMTDQELKLEKARAEYTQATVPLQNKGLWKLQDSADIGRFLYARM